MALAIGHPAIQPPGLWARRAALQPVGDLARRAWPGVLGLTGAGVVAAIVVQVSAAPWLRGFLAGTALAFGIAALPVLAMFLSGRSVNRWNSAGAEVLTAERFEGRRCRRAGVRVFHGLQLNGCDVDHVAVGPGGVYAVETKWVGESHWSMEGTVLHGTTGQPLSHARRAAEKVRSLLRSVNGGAPIWAPVHPVLVLWGPGVHLGPEPRLVDGVLLVRGSESGHWDELVRYAPIGRVAADAVAAKVGGFARAQWRDARRAA